jgi:hypothetical protein
MSNGNYYEVTFVTFGNLMTLKLRPSVNNCPRMGPVVIVLYRFHCIYFWSCKYDVIVLRERGPITLSRWNTSMKKQFLASDLA